ncbi:response regulator transcription factor [Serratia grimesii]|uniref:response regulator transcription factor n=1 Tax=Serratia grimesii TaxID=82995 RepID=UPI0039B00C1E
MILYLSFGVSNKTIGQLLNISEKTVSSHKRSAMRKLHLRRDIELNYWLLHGGLYSIHRGHNIRDIKCPTPTANTPHVLSQTA